MSRSEKAEQLRQEALRLEAAAQLEEAWKNTRGYRGAHGVLVLLLYEPTKGWCIQVAPPQEGNLELKAGGVFATLPEPDRFFESLISLFEKK